MPPAPASAEPPASQTCQKLSRLEIRGLRRRRSIKVPVEQHAEIGCWTMTPEATRAAEKAKLVLMFEEWVDACEWGPTKLDISSDLRGLAHRLESLSLSLQATPPLPPARLGELANSMIREPNPTLALSLRSAIVNGFYGDPENT